MMGQIVFCILLMFTGYFTFNRILIIAKTIHLGKPEIRSDKPQVRLSRMLFLAFGQKKMFDKPVVGILHFLVYSGFILINLEVVEIILDGILGTHRLFLPLLGERFYTFLINFFELLALGVLGACIIFLIRRNILKINRLQESNHSELRGFPIKDANTILMIEIILMTAILLMNASDSLLQSRLYAHYPSFGQLIISQGFIPFLSHLSSESLVLVERVTWWAHIVGIFFFAIYVTYSKHLHIFLAFPNAYFSTLDPKGKMQTMENITQEVKIMLGLANDTGAAPPERFGAKDVNDLSWKNLMDAYSCTECGRCTAVCPANLTAKKLSPRKIMMDTRDRLEDIGKQILEKKDWKEDGKSLYGDYITAEELRACTTCNACVEACPVMISPLDIILQLRRYQIMDESSAPHSWNMMFSNLETNQSPWKFSPSDRLNWSK